MRDMPYCNAPWLGLAYEGTKGCKPCCEWKGKTFWGTYTEYVESDYLKDFKQKMYRDGPEDVNCIECTHNEKIGGHSRRKYYDKFKEVDYESSGLNYIARMDFRAGNKCNMMCRMCGPESSSLLEEEMEIGGFRSKGFIKRIDTADVYDLDLTHCTEISILGGEPSIDLEVRKFMNHVADNYPNIKIMVTTNGTNASDKWFKTLRRFCDNAGLQIILSVDAAGEVQDFQRSGGDWNKIKKNLVKYKNLEASMSPPSLYSNLSHLISIQLTATAINMSTLDKWWDELLSLEIQTHLNQVWWPQGMSIEAIPDEYREQSINFLQDWMKQFDESQSKDSIVGHKIDAAKSAIEILSNSKYNKGVSRKFIQLQNSYDRLRNEDITKLDERFKVMMI
jgi:organic radical activating enzyme